MRDRKKQKVKTADSASSEVDHAAIAARAYERFERRGRVHGHDLEDWLAAERELLGDAGPARIPSRMNAR